MKYQPPKTAPLSDFQIINLFSKTLLSKEGKNKADPLYKDLIDYGFSTLKKSYIYEFNLFLFVYTNLFHKENENLIIEALDLFDLEKIKKNDNFSSLEYMDELVEIYKSHYFHIEKIKNLVNNKLEKYLIKFYSLYIYFLNKINQNGKMFAFLKELDSNKIDDLILPKLFISNYYNIFYKTLLISEDIKIILINKLIIVSNYLSDFLNSFSLISNYMNKDFIKILLYIKYNYDKIFEMCLERNIL